jgi:formylglycine-generating enzyme required for sulfatase activity
MKRFVWLLVVAALVGSTILYQKYGTATVAITSEPAAGAVWIDGRRVGTTPIKREPVASGKHLITIEHSTFAPYEHRFSVAVGNHIEHHAILKPGKAVMLLVSNPKGAWIEINGERLQAVTPHRYETVSGVFDVTVGLPERRPVTKQVTLNNGATEEVTIDLNPDPHGSLRVIAPGQAKVTVLNHAGQNIAYKPGVRVPIGEYTIQVSARGFDAVEQRVKVVGGDNTVRMDMARHHGEFRVEVTPAEAEVLVNGRRYSGPVRLPTGSVEVRARAMGYRSQVRQVNLGEGGATARLQLEAMRVTAGQRLRDRLQSGRMAPEMTIAPAGEFRMGSDSGAAGERPEHTVRHLVPFAISVTEVTVDDWLVFVAATGRAVDKRLDVTLKDHPVTYVTWDDAIAYTRWLSRETGAVYRLPSEGEWEYAARAGTSTRWYFGSDPAAICAHGNVADAALKTKFREWTVADCDDGSVRMNSVGRYASNAWGLKDVYGNASEWVLDCGRPPYGSATTIAPQPVIDESCEGHGFRGGSWDSASEETTSSSRAVGSSANGDRGIRLVREL